MARSKLKPTRLILISRSRPIYIYIYHMRMHSDSAVKQILLTMNEKQSFIIEDLDEHHVVIKADEEWRVRRDLEAEVRARACVSFQGCLTGERLAAREEHV